MADDRDHENELVPEILGVNSLDPFFANSTAARSAMMSTHAGQTYVTAENEQRRVFSGMDLKYGEETFGIRFPCNARVLKVLRKYPVGNALDAIRENPLTTVIYEDYYCPLGTVGVLDVPNFMSFHQTFGFKCHKRDEVWERIAEGALFEEGETVATSSAVKRDGSYGLGLHAEVAYMSHEGSVEDGFVMSEEFLARTAPTAYGKLVGNWGKRHFPLNLYGDEKRYKPFPDIGEILPASGLAMAFRRIDPRLGIAEMTPRALREPDHSYDELVWGKSKARIVDIKVYHDERLNPSFTPIGMDTQARKYYDALCHYYRTLLSEYQRLKKLRRQRGQPLSITPAFNQLLMDAQYYLPQPDMNERKLTRMHRLETLDEWRVELTYEWIMSPDEGFKYTNFYGGKGVDCKTLPKEQMPVDQNGNRADIIIYGNTVVNRTNVGQLYEQAFNAAGRDYLHKLRKEVGMDPHTKPTFQNVEKITADTVWTEETFAQLLKLYRIISPVMYEDMKHHPDPRRHVNHFMVEGHYFNIPTNSPKSPMEAFDELIKSEFCPHMGPVTYYTSSGKKETTILPVLIGGQQIMALEKTGDDWSAGASVKVQHFGVPAKLTQFDRHTSPARQSAVRGLGEPETRSWACTVGPELTSEMLVLSNSPDIHRKAVNSIVTAKYPTNIPRIVDPKLIRSKGTRPVNLANHILACRGVKFVYVPDTVYPEENG